MSGSNVRDAVILHGGNMKQFTLTMLDTSGIQNYIFNNNWLQEAT